MSPKRWQYVSKFVWDSFLYEIALPFPPTLDFQGLFKRVSKRFQRGFQDFNMVFMYCIFRLNVCNRKYICYQAGERKLQIRTSIQMHFCRCIHTTPLLDGFRRFHPDNNLVATFLKKSSVSLYKVYRGNKSEKIV